MDIETKDGILLRNIPEGTPDEVIKARIARIRAGHDGREPMGTQTKGWKPYTPSGEQTGGIANITPAEAIMGHPVTQFAVGAAEPVLGGLQAVGVPIDAKAIKAMSERGGQLYGGSLTQVPARVAGNVLSPVWLGAAGAIPAAATIPQAILQGAGLGAAAGATSLLEDNNLTNRAINTGVGGLVGGTVSGGLAAGSKAYKAFVQPMVDVENAAGRVYNEAAGTRTPQVIAELKAPQTIVPGSAPTAGEAATGAGATKFSALQKQAEAVLPDEYLARQQAQNAARLAAVRSVGQDKAALEAAEASRKAITDPMYAAARSATAPVKTAAVEAKVQGILDKNPGNRELVTELKNILSGLKQSQNDPQKVASVLDGMKAAIKDEKNTFIRGVLTNIKDDLVNAIPGYQKAQAVFAVKSQPINQMQVGQELERKLVPALSEEAKQRAGVFAEAMRNAPQTIKKATGQPRFEELAQVLTPKQLQAVNQVKDELARGALFEQQAQKGLAAAPNLTHAIEGKLPSILERQVVVANTILGRLEKAINKKLAAKIAVQMLDDLPGVASTMESAAQKAARNTYIERLILSGGVQAGMNESQ